MREAKEDRDFTTIGRAVLSCALASMVTLIATAQTSKPKPSPPRIGPTTKPKPAPPAEKKVAPAPTPPPAPTDLKVSTKSINGAQVTETGMYFTKARQRFDFPGIAMIRSATSKRTLQINDGAKLYMVQPFDEGKPQPAAPAAHLVRQLAAPASGATAQSAPKGGIIKHTTTSTDTGERKVIFGLEAHRSGRDAGAKFRGVRQTFGEGRNGWLDTLIFPITRHAPLPYPQPLAAAPPLQQTKVRASIAPRRRPLAMQSWVFRLSTVTTTSGEKQDVSIITTEVTDLQITTLDPALFDVPPGYSEVKGYPELLPNIAAGGSVADAVFGSISAGTSTVAPEACGVRSHWHHRARQQEWANHFSRHAARRVDGRFCKEAVRLGAGHGQDARGNRP